MKKEYAYYKTSNKTALENNLIFIKYNQHNLLFDFTILDGIGEIPDQIKLQVKDACLNDVRPANRTVYYGCIIDTFTAYDGIAEFAMYRIYDTTSKYFYSILQMVEIKHHYKTRKSIYDKCYDVVDFIRINGRSVIYDTEINFEQGCR